MNAAEIFRRAMALAPGLDHEGQLRSSERRVKEWRTVRAERLCWRHQPPLQLWPQHASMADQITDRREAIQSDAVEFDFAAELLAKIQLLQGF
jgi:hypothetical protein